MTIEQTTQLIQLILNSVVMVTACLIVLGGLLVRYSAIKNQLQIIHWESFELLSDPNTLKNVRLVQLKQQLRRLRQSHRVTHNSVLLILYALLFFVTSTLVLSLRTMLDFVWLIPASLFFFILGLGSLLLALVLALADFHASDRSVWEEMKWILNLSKGKHMNRERPQLMLSSTPISARRIKQKPATKPRRHHLPNRSANPRFIA
ncbi:MAG: DUF2721 domain-containing protein [Cyanothece sp. SIO1E1]|nr:DUF2721 domain-containing protein [Cyanothece sp. SIO1E1]